MEGIYHDEKHYKRSLDTYMKISNRFVQWVHWLDAFFANQVLDVLEENIPPSVGVLRILGVGCGSGDVDHDLLSRLVTRYSRISNTVLEPTDAISEYKALSEVKPLPGVEWNWRQGTFDTYHQSIVGNPEVPKFHFISALAVLYYMHDWEAEVLNMYNLLEEGGVLMITLVSEKSGNWRVWERFPMLADSLTIQVNSSHVQAFLRTKKISFHVVKHTSFVDITCCSIDGDEEGSMLIDFITHVKHFKTEAPPKLRADFMNYIFSAECSHKDENRILLDDSTEAIIVRK